MGNSSPAQQTIPHTKYVLVFSRCVNLLQLFYPDPHQKVLSTPLFAYLSYSEIIYVIDLRRLYIEYLHLSTKV